MIELKHLSLQGAIIDAIKREKENLRKIVSLGIPPSLQADLTAMVIHKPYGGKPIIKQLYGLTVTDSERLTITTEIAPFIRADD